MALDANGQPLLNEDVVNNVHDGNAGDILRILRLGDMYRGNLVQHVRKFNFVTAVVSPYSLATVQTLVLPDKSRACTILRATAKTGAGTPGEVAVVAYGATPTAGQIAVGPNGNIVALIADGWTDIDVVYTPERGNVLEVTLAVSTNVLTLPASITATGAVLLLEAEALVGTAVGTKIPLVPGAGAPAAGQARLNLAKTTVTFAGADAVTRARVKVLLGVPATQSIDGVLSATPGSLGVAI